MGIKRAYDKLLWRRIAKIKNRLNISMLSLATNVERKQGSFGLDNVDIRMGGIPCNASRAESRIEKLPSRRNLYR